MKAIASSKTACKFLAALLALVEMIFPVKIGYEPGIELKNAEQPYPYVFVHGFAGWGFDDPLTDLASYWGLFGGDLIAYLNENGNGCECYNASCGSFSSAWDRACELYAQLCGNTVDYGAAHSEKYGHARYGKTYENPLFEGWSAEKKINIIAHSFGGNTARLLAQLLASGSEQERAASSADGSLSALFTGGNSGLIHSISTLASPHNGTTLVAAMGLQQSSAMANVANSLLCAMGCSPLNLVFDADLEQWGMNGSPFDFSLEKVRQLSDTPDTGMYDLSLKGAAELNEFIEEQSDIYYFSYAGCNTKKSALTGNDVPLTACLSSATALAIGRFSGEVDGITVDETWHPNDGIVNTVSALAPFDEAQCDYGSASVTHGVWQVMPVVNFDHHSFTMSSGITSRSTRALAELIISQMNIIAETY